MKFAEHSYSKSISEDLANIMRQDLQSLDALPQEVIESTVVAVAVAGCAGVWAIAPDTEPAPRRRGRPGNGVGLHCLSGLGDLILTCSSTQSRNMSLGKAIGEELDKLGEMDSETLLRMREERFLQLGG